MLAAHSKQPISQPTHAQVSLTNFFEKLPEALLMMLADKFLSLESIINLLLVNRYLLRSSTILRSIKIRKDSLIKNIRISKDSGILLNKGGLLYTWGVNVDGVLGCGEAPLSIDPDQYIPPRKIPTLRNIKSIEARSNQRYALSKDGTLFAWGDNNEGRLGLPEEYQKIKSIMTPRPVTAVGDKVRDFFIQRPLPPALARPAIVVLTKEEVYIKYIDENQFKKILSLEGKSIKKIFIACEGFFVLSTSGELWVWGKNHLGQLGLGDFENRGIPCKINNLPAVEDLASEGVLIMAITKEGDLYKWGYSSQGKRLHTPKMFNALTNAHKPICKQLLSSLGFYLLLTEEGRLYVLDTQGILEITNSALKIEKVFLSQEGSIFALPKERYGQKLLSRGNNTHNQLGIVSNQPLIEEFKELTFESKDIKDIKFNNGLTAIITQQGKLFICGNNKVKRCAREEGHQRLKGFPDTIPTFTEIKISENVLDVIMTNCQFFACLSDRPYLRVWGENAFYNDWRMKVNHYGALGLPSDASESLSKIAKNSFLSMSQVPEMKESEIKESEMNDEISSVHGYASLLKSIP